MADIEWKMVPVKMTPAMLHEAKLTVPSSVDFCDADIEDIYESALTAAPPVQEAKPVACEHCNGTRKIKQANFEGGISERDCPKCAHPAQEAVTRAGVWLIEWPDDGNLHPLRWWHGEFGYTRDSNKTPRFARREDAEMAIKYLKLDGATAVEHIWMDSDAALAALEPKHDAL